jgi:hypothetical protein
MSKYGFCKNRGFKKGQKNVKKRLKMTQNDKKVSEEGHVFDLECPSNP